MKADIHPKLHPVVFVDAQGGAEFVMRSTLTSEETKKINGVDHFVIRVDISSASHPFYTGKQVLVDTAGRVDKFRAREEASKKAKAEQESRKTQKAKKESVEEKLTRKAAEKEAAKEAEKAEKAAQKKVAAKKAAKKTVVKKEAKAKKPAAKKAAPKKK